MILFPRLHKHPIPAESIYKWADVYESEIHQTDPLYKSKYNSAVKKFYKSVKSPRPKTMGYSQTPLRPPHDYLKKHTGGRRIDESKSITCICRQSRRCSKSSDFDDIGASPILLKRSERNFIRENTLDAVKRPATAPEPRIADDRRGNSFALENSGLDRKFVYKEDYGKTPKYIQDIEMNLEESRERFKDYILAREKRVVPTRMTEEAKEEIFTGLVRNWKELLSRYLAMPVNSETPLQLKRKLETERRIDALEHDIELLLKNKDILIGKHNIPFRR